MTPTAINPTSASHHRFHLLDALRGFAALFVVILHLPGIMTAGFPANGVLAVDFFFCLSGFVIGFSYEKRLSTSLSFRDFAAARWIRLYPIYLLGSALGLLSSLLVAFMVHTLSQNFRRFAVLSVLSLCMWPTRLSPINELANFPLNGPAWSLFYEMVANLVFALLIKARAAGSLILAAITIVSLGLLVRLVAGNGTIDVGFLAATLGSGFARVAFGFTLGLLLHRLYRVTAPPPALHHTPIVVTVALTAIIGLVLAAPAAWMRTEFFRLLAITVVLPAVVYFGARVRLPRSWNGLCAALGNVSYPLYLLHAPFLLPLFSVRFQRLAQAHPAATHIMVPVILFGLAAAAWWVGESYDVPIRRWLMRRYKAAILPTPVG